ncbi:MAG: hypothetical protein HYZ75_10075 [Elusimicrobia bacterium]|nr:hypothetical protein [Elusimicrobiota bacterium]
MRAWTSVVLVLALAGCRSGWHRRVPPFKYVFRPSAVPFMENPKFSFEIKRRWKGPTQVEGGVRFKHPGGAAAITVSYHLEGAPGWKDPREYRRWMRQQGSTADSHIVDEVELSSRAAAHVVFTTHEYSPEYLLGVKVAVARTELFMLPDAQGIFLIRYDAPVGEFARHRRVLERLLDSLTLAIFETPVVE